MATDPSGELTTRLNSDEELRAKVTAAPADEHRSILADAGDTHHEALDDDELAAVVGGFTMTTIDPDHTIIK